MNPSITGCRSDQDAGAERDAWVYMAGKSKGQTFEIEHSSEESKLAGQTSATRNQVEKRKKTLYL